ncbi:hypothetical protein EMIT079MI2_370008 [Bacillus sp. IT-79MI2]
MYKKMNRVILNGKIGKKESLNNAFRNHYLLHRSCRKKR